MGSKIADLSFSFGVVLAKIALGCLLMGAMAGLLYLIVWLYAFHPAIFVAILFVVVGYIIGGILLSD